MDFQMLNKSVVFITINFLSTRNIFIIKP